MNPFSVRSIFIVFYICIAFYADALEFHVAPMVGYTNRHFRYLIRLMSSDCVLWTEMIKPRDILHVPLLNQQSVLMRGIEENTGKCVLQLGDDNADDLVQSIKIASMYNYDEYNLNLGCPSIETNAHFGASLMKRSDHAVYLVNKMSEEAAKTSKSVSIKCRVGVHDSYKFLKEDQYDYLYRFLSEMTTVMDKTNDIIIHARSAVLQGLSPSGNREVPPLRLDFVRQAVQDFPNSRIIMNGGLTNVEQLLSEQALCPRLTGFMAGRWMLRQPLDMLNVQFAITNKKSSLLSTDTNKMDKKKVIEMYGDYASQELLRIERQNGGYINLEEFASVLMPIALLSYQIMYDYEIALEHSNDGDDISTNQALDNLLLFRYIVEVSIPLFATTKLFSISELNDLELKLKFYISDNSNSCGNALIDIEDDSLMRLYRKHFLKKALGKKVLTKLKGNVSEKYSISSRNSFSCEDDG